MGKKVIKKRKRKVVVTPNGRAYINASFNNLIITITNSSGDTVAWSSGGKLGYRNAKKRTTPLVAMYIADDCGKLAVEYGVKTLDVFLKGVGVGRETALRTLVESGLKLNSITDRTSLPFGGCRPRKMRRN